MTKRWMQSTIVVTVLSIGTMSRAQETEIRPVSFPQEQLRLPANSSARVGTQFVGINDQGTVVGSIVVDAESNGVESHIWHGIIYRAGRFTVVDGPLPFNISTRGIAINNRGEALFVQASDQGPRYFLYDSNDQSFRPVSTAAGITVAGKVYPFYLTEITGMNDAGEVVGFVTGTAGVYGKPMVGPAGSLTVPDGLASFTGVPCPDSLHVIRTGGINNHRDVAESCGSGSTLYVLKADGTSMRFDDTGSFPRLKFNNGMNLNDSGVVVGFSAVGAIPKGFIYRDSELVLYSDPKFQRSGTLEPYAINNRGQVAGTLGTGRNGTLSGFITQLRP